MRAGLAAFAFVLAATAAQAGELRGRVVAVADGDTLTILDASRQRAMLNFSLTSMRVVDPRDGWPNPKAVAMASGAASQVLAFRTLGGLARLAAPGAI